MKSTSSASRFSRSGQSLVGLLVVGALLLALGAYFLLPTSSENGKPQRSTLKRSIDRGESVATGSNISQIQQIIEMYKNDNDGRPPASLDELRRYAKDFPAEMWVDGVSKQPLVYDATTGRISAPVGSNANVPAAGAPGAVPNAIPGIPNVDVAPPPEPAADEN